jgi:hypothetical protein
LTVEHLLPINKMSDLKELKFDTQTHLTELDWLTNKNIKTEIINCKNFKNEAAHNSTYPKGGVSCSKDSFVVNQTLVFQIKFCGKSPALRVAAKR